MLLEQLWWSWYGSSPMDAHVTITAPIDQWSVRRREGSREDWLDVYLSGHIRE
jgi:hypothetical protein